MHAVHAPHTPSYTVAEIRCFRIWPFVSFAILSIGSRAVHKGTLDVRYTSATSTAIAVAHEDGQVCCERVEHIPIDVRVLFD